MKKCDVELTNSPITSSKFDDISCSLAYCEKDGVDVLTPSLALLSTNAAFSPSFEKHTTSIGSQLFNKMGYTRGGLRKNGQSTTIAITLTELLRDGLRYNENSFPNRDEFGKTIRVLFVASGNQNKLLEDQPIVDNYGKKNENLTIHNMLESGNVITNDIFVDV